MRSLLSMRTFWLITALGHGCIFLGTLLFYFFERAVNPGAEKLIDCLVWAVASVTGNDANISPLTAGGKLTSIFLMISGAFFLWTYMALFIGILIQPELTEIEHDVSEIQHEVKDLL